MTGSHQGSGSHQAVVRQPFRLKNFVRDRLKNHCFNQWFDKNNSEILNLAIKTLVKWFHKFRIPNFHNKKNYLVLWVYSGSSYWLRCVEILNLGLLVNSWNHEVNSSLDLKTFCWRPIKTLAKVCQFDFTPLPHLWHEKWMLVGPITVTFGYVAYKIVTDEMVFCFENCFGYFDRKLL